MEQVDRKFLIEAEHITKGIKHTERDAVLFLAKDNAFPATLRFYRQECERLGADVSQLLSVDLLIDRVDTWRRLNPDQCKVPDVDYGEEYGIQCRPNRVEPTE